MWRFNFIEGALSFLSLLLTTASSQAVTPDMKLVALVPPTAQIVAGMNGPPRSGQPRSFLMSAHSAVVDLNDFIALTAVDSSRAPEQIILAASEGGGDAFAEHSLLASGRFDRGLIHRSAYGAGAKATNYRGIPVLEIQPLTRERNSLIDVRWLSMMDSKLALFGTIRMVRQELDRYLDHSAVDPSLERRLARLRHDDATWCVLTLPEQHSEIQAMFQILDSRFSDLLHVGDTIQFGVHYGRQVEFEYEVWMAGSRDPEEVRRFLKWSLTEQDRASLLPVGELSLVDHGVRGVLKVSKARYQSWIAGALATSAKMRAAADSSTR